MDNLYVTGRDLNACRAAIDCLAHGFSKWGVILKPGSTAFLQPGSGDAPFCELGSLTARFPCLGGIIDSDGTTRSVLQLITCRIRVNVFRFVKSAIFKRLSPHRRFLNTMRDAKSILAFLLHFYAPALL